MAYIILITANSHEPPTRLLVRRKRHMVLLQRCRRRPEARRAHQPEEYKVLQHQRAEVPGTVADDCSDGQVFGDAVDDCDAGG
jgi:hypothetical protein